MRKITDMAYLEKQQSIAVLISDIRHKLGKHADSAANWGHVGDLGHVEELLNQISNFLD